MHVQNVFQCSSAFGCSEILLKSRRRTSTGEGARKLPVCRPPHFLISNYTLYVRALKFYWVSNESWVLHEKDTALLILWASASQESLKKAEQKLRFCLCNPWNLYSCNILKLFLFKMFKFQIFFLFLLGDINGTVNVCFQDTVQNIFHKAVTEMWEVEYANSIFYSSTIC